MPNSGVLWIGDPSWIATANNISVAQSLRPLVWNATLTNLTAAAVQAAANASGQCGVNARPSEGISFTLSSPLWERAGNSPLLRMQSAAWNAPPSAVSNGFLGSEFAASDIRPLAYVFAGPDPVAIGCVVQSCNTTFSQTTCLTNLTTNSSAANAATSFALEQRQPLEPVGSCQPLSIDVVKGLTLEDVVDQFNDQDPRNVSELQVACWYAAVCVLQCCGKRYAPSLTRIEQPLTNHR